MKGYMMNFINKFTCIVTCAMSLISYNCNAMCAQADKDLMGLHAQLIAGLATQEQPVNEGTLIDRCLAYSLKTEQVRPFMGPILEIGHALQSLLKHKQQLDKDDTENITFLVLRVYPFTQPDSKNQASLLVQMIIGGIQGQQTSKRVHAELTQKDDMLTSMPDDVIRLITEYLPAGDVVQLPKTCKTMQNLFRKTPHILVPIIVERLLETTVDPIECINNKKKSTDAGNAEITIFGCTVPAQELKDAVHKKLSESIIEILITKEFDPVEFICTQAKGNSRVTLYGHEFDTEQLLRQLYDKGVCPLRIAQDQNDQQSLTLEAFFHSNDGGNSDYIGQAIVPACYPLQAPKSFLKKLSAEEQLDYARWFWVRFDPSTAGGYQELLATLDQIHAANPQACIWLNLWGTDSIGGQHQVLERELVESLAKYPITALSIDDFALPEGTAPLSALKHLRVLTIALTAPYVIDNLLTNELCTLPELRAIEIVIDSTIACPRLIVPQAIGNLKKLQYLCLAHCEFEGLENLAKAPQLRILKLISPEFSEIPENICNLYNLRALYWGTFTDDVQVIDVTSIPKKQKPKLICSDKIADLKNLIGLKIRCPYVPFLLPSAIGQLRSLRLLSLSDCMLMNLPQELDSLRYLRILELNAVVTRADFADAFKLLLQRVKIIGQDRSFKIFEDTLKGLKFGHTSF